jgi:hypothetical protein
MFCCPRSSQLSTILNNIVEPESGVTTLFNIVDNCEQCGQQSIVQSCFHQYCINLSVFCRVSRLKIEKINNLFEQVDINRREQGCAAHYEQYIVNMLLQHCSTVTIWNNMVDNLFIVGHTTLFTPVDINLEQPVRF